MDEVPPALNNPAPAQPQPATAPPGPSQPQHPMHVKHAHRFLMVYVAILLAALVGGGIYAWQNSKIKTLNNNVSALNAQLAKVNNQLKAAEAALPSNSNAGNAPNNPYAGWKTFCDDFSNVCLRYPKDWVITGSTSSAKTSETFTNASNSALVSYDNPYSSDKSEQVYFISDIEDLTIKNLGPQIVGRVLGNTPEYVFSDSSYLTANHVTVGKTLSFVSSSTFSTNEKGVTARLEAAPTSGALSNIKTADQASAWFKTDDAKTSLKILQSFYYQ